MSQLNLMEKISKSKLSSGYSLLAKALLLSCWMNSGLGQAKTNFDREALSELLKDARSYTAGSFEQNHSDAAEAMDLDLWITLFRQDANIEAGDASNLRLASQLIASQNFEGQQANSQLLLQALNYEFYEEPARALASLAKIDPRSMTKAQNTLWYQIQLRCLITTGQRQAAHKLLQTLIKTNMPVLLTWPAYHEATKLLADLSSNEQIQFYIRIIDRHPNRRVLKDAYQKLMAADYSKFTFEYQFLRRLALSRDVVDGLQGWLADVFEQANIKRFRNHEVDYLRLMLLMRIDELKRAEKIARQLVARNENKRLQHLEYSNILGQILERLNRAGEAFNLYSDLLERYGRNRDTRMIWESYARLLGQSSSFADAAREFGGLVRVDSRRHIRWFYFWYLYRAERYQEALALIERNRNAHIYARDAREPLGIRYWQARIYEKTGRETEALALYRQILRDEGASFYTTLIVGQTESEGKGGQRILRSELAKSGDTRQTGNEAQNQELNMINVPAMSYLEWREARSRSRNALFNISDFNSLVASQMDNKSQWMQAYPLHDYEWMKRVCDFFELDPLILASVIRAESFYNPSAVSPVGAQGLMQIMSYTALKISRELNDSKFNFSELQNPRISIVYGAYYIRKLLDYFGNNLILTLAAYNAGPFKTMEWVESCGMCEADEFVESVTYQETRRYIKSILANYAHYKRIYRQEISPVVASSIPYEFSRGALIY